MRDIKKVFESPVVSVPMVSIIIPVYKVERYLRKCLQSVVKQTLENIEIICVNDGSPDSCLQIMQEFAAKDSRIKIIDKPNSGYGNSVNRGMAVATGEYISIVESDDFIAEDMLESLYALSQDGTVDVVKGNFYEYYVEVDGSARIVVNNERDMVPDSKEPFILQECGQISWGHPSVWSAIYRRAFLEEYGICFLEEKGGGWVDNPFFYETLCRAKSIMWTKRPYYYYMKSNEESSSNNQMDPRIPLQRMLDNLDVMEKCGCVALEARKCAYARALMYLTGTIQDFDYGKNAKVISVLAEKLMRHLDEDTIMQHFNVSDKVKYLNYASPLKKLQAKADRVLIYNWLPFDNPWHWGGGVTVYCYNLIKEILRDTSVEVYFLSSGFAYDGSTMETFVREIGNVFGPRVHQYEIVNSPVPADQRFLYRNPLVALENETLKQTFSNFIKDHGPFKIVHFNNIEGLSFDVFDLKKQFLTTRFIFSLHNYVPLCANGFYYMRHKHCICHPGRTGEDCLACTRADIRNNLANEMFDRGKVGVKEQNLISRARWLKAFGFERLDQDVTADRIQDFAKTATAKISANCDQVLAVSQRVYDIAAVNGFDKSKMQVSYIGTKVAENQLGHAATQAEPGKGIKVVFLGSDINFEEKGFAFLLDALEQLEYSCAQQIDLLITVRNPEHAEIYRMLKDFRSVKILNGYTHDDLPEIFAGAHLSIVPVLWEDNLPQIAIESAAYGVPVLASSAGGASELCDSALFEFQQGDGEDLRQKLKHFLKAPGDLNLYWEHHHGLVTMRQHWDELSMVYGLQEADVIELKRTDYIWLLKEHDFLCQAVQEQDGLRQRLVDLEQERNNLGDSSKHDLGFEADPRFHFPWKAVSKGSRLVIYGGGVVGKTYLVQALSADYIDLVAVCDRNPAQTGIRDLRVIDVDQLAGLSSDDYDLILIANEKESIAKDIRNTLQDKGVPQKKIKWVNPVLA